LFVPSVTEVAMSLEGGETARGALTAAIVTALRQHTRHSAHPADQAALRHVAARIARALEAEFDLISRHSPVSGLTNPERRSATAHE